jgi:hypothetical protein
MEAKRLKCYMVTYYSRYYRFETHKRKVTGLSKSDIRNRWHEIMLTDEYIIKSIEDIKEDRFIIV